MQLLNVKAPNVKTQWNAVAKGRHELQRLNHC